jgi:CHAT domain-containing protein/tetratricopeptide (TPR) repeat protein
MAIAVSLMGSDRDRIGWTRYEHSIFLDRLGHFDSAMIEASAAESLAAVSNDKPLRASSFSAMGRIHSLSGQYREALASNQTAISIEREYGAEPRVISKEMNELGIDYRHLGRFTDAVGIYDSALVIARRIGNQESIARVEFNLGEIRRETGDEQGALTLFNDALARAAEIGEVRGMAFIHGGLAEIYMDAGAFDKARAHLTRALDINRSARLTYGQLQNLEGIGRIDLRENKPVAADSAFHTALLLADSGRYGKERSTLRAALARAAAARGHGAAARRWADVAVAIADSLGDPAPQAEARSARAVALEVTNNDAAAKAYVDAINVLESWRGRLALGDLRMGVASPHLEAYEGAIRTLLSAGKTEAALDIAERARARLLLELMAERDLRATPGDRESRLRQKLRERFAARGDANDNQGALLDREIAAITDSLDAIQKRARAHDLSAGVRYPAPAVASELEASLANGDRALLVYFWGEHAVYGWWISGRIVHAARLGNADSLAATVDFLRGTIASAANGPDWRPSARKAYDSFVLPLHPAPASNVMVVTDGALSSVPLETFIPPSQSIPWGATKEFVYGPSASVLLSLVRTRKADAWRKQILAVGDPGTSSSNSSTTRSANARLPSLPAAAAEARNVATIFGGDALIGTQATVARWLAHDPGSYRYLHFATHAVLDDRHPQETSLALADGRLDLAAIRRIRLSSELVTLSACETGLGQRLRGEGIIGLPHAFLSAGAKSVVVSLWKVEDSLAAGYMADFYRAMRAGSTPAQAMLAVRASRIASKGFMSHPSYWAPFVLVGEPQAVPTR